jgi:uncharacterized membrane protein
MTITFDVTGIIFYVTAAILYNFSSNYWGRFALLLVAISGLALSGFLAFVMAYIIQKVCVVCAATYISNLLIFFTAISVFMEGSHSTRSNATVKKGN